MRLLKSHPLSYGEQALKTVLGMCRCNRGLFQGETYNQQGYDEGLQVLIQNARSVVYFPWITIRAAVNTPLRVQR